MMFPQKVEQEKVAKKRELTHCVQFVLGILHQVSRESYQGLGIRLIRFGPPAMLRTT